VVRLLHLRDGRFTDPSGRLLPWLRGGALAPIIATALYPTGGTLLISIYIAAVCALSAVCYALAAETYRKDIYEEEPEERRLVAQQQG